MTLAWVLGARGLLGSAFCRALAANGTALFAPSEYFSWTDPLKIRVQIEAAVREFSAASAQSSKWEIYWAAGVGSMTSTDESLMPETLALQQILQLIRADDRLSEMSGAIAFSSSAGAIYSLCADDVITEASLPAPNSAYARAKLRQEALLREFCVPGSKVTVLLARISTLYGVGQSAGKQQGLLAHIARSIIRNKPIGIYVPIDTIRDYIWAEDAAAEIVETVRELAEPGALVKIVASGRPVTIAEIISIFKRITRKSPRITTSASKASSLYLRRVQFHSIVSHPNRKPKARSLAVGIAQLFWAERFSHANPEKQTRWTP